MHLPAKQKLYASAASLALLGGVSYAGIHSIRPDAPLSVAPISGKTPPAPSDSGGERPLVDTTKPATIDSAANEPKEVVVAMAGAVKIPGLLHLTSDARVGDAIKRAGGAKADADLDRINLAAKLVDGDQVYVPHRKAAEPEKATEVAKIAPRHRGGEISFHYEPLPPVMPPPLRGKLTTSGGRPTESKPPVEEGPPSGDLPNDPSGNLPLPGQAPTEGSSPSTGEAIPSGGHGHHSAKTKATEPVSLNTAGEAELETLPGVGPATAQKILDYRQQHGRFGSIEEIMSVRGIGAKKFEKMKPFLKL